MSQFQGQYSILSTAEIPATGHNYVNGVCTVCGASDPNYAPGTPCESGHDWKAPTYSWSADYSSVTAERLCSRDASHVERETVKTTVEVTQPATTSATGEMAYTAAFQNTAFKTQTKTVVIPKLNATNPFVDVDKGVYFYEPVLWAVNHDPKITTGTDAKHFSPSATCNRAQVVTFLWRANGCPAVSGTSNPFKDVKKGAYYYDAVLWAVSKGITSGTSKTTFSPEDSCTRGQVVTFLWRSLDKPTLTGEHAVSNPFADVKKGAYYYDAVLWAVAAQVTSGTSATTFSPSRICTRAQVVTFLYRSET